MGCTTSTILAHPEIKVYCTLLCIEWSLHYFLHRANRYTGLYHFKSWSSLSSVTNLIFLSHICIGLSTDNKLVWVIIRTIHFNPTLLRSISCVPSQPPSQPHLSPEASCIYKVDRHSLPQTFHNQATSSDSLSKTRHKCAANARIMLNGVSY